MLRTSSYTQILNKECRIVKKRIPPLFYWKLLFEKSGSSLFDIFLLLIAYDKNHNIESRQWSQTEMLLMRLHFYKKIQTNIGTLKG